MLEHITSFKFMRMWASHHDCIKIVKFRINKFFKTSINHRVQVTVINLNNIQNVIDSIGLSDELLNEKQ